MGTSISIGTSISNGSSSGLALWLPSDDPDFVLNALPSDALSFSDLVAFTSCIEGGQIASVRDAETDAILGTQSTSDARMILVKDGGKWAYDTVDNTQVRNLNFGNVGALLASGAGTVIITVKVLVAGTINSYRPIQSTDNDSAFSAINAAYHGLLRGPRVEGGVDGTPPDIGVTNTYTIQSSASEYIVRKNGVEVLSSPPNFLAGESWLLGGSGWSFAHLRIFGMQVYSSVITGTRRTKAESYAMS